MSAPAGPVTVLHMDTGRAWRGGQRHMHWLLTGLRARGHHAMLATRPDAPLARRAAADGVPLLPIDPAIAEWGPWTVLRLRRAIAKLGIQVLHAHDGHSVALAVLAAAGTAARVVVTRHVVFPLRRTLGTRLKFGRVDHVIAVSQAVARMLEAGGIPAERITVVPAGIPPALVAAPAAPDVLAALGVPGGAPLAVMVTSLYGYKDPLTFVRAVAVARQSVPELHAVLTGEGPLRDVVAAEIATLGLGDRVHLAGFRDDALALMAAADVVCLTSREEGLPVSIMEAMALRRPVVTTAAGGAPELVRDGREGLVLPVGDADAVGAALARVLGDAALAAGMGEAGGRRATAFTTDAATEGAIAVYRRTLAG